MINVKNLTILKDYLVQNYSKISNHFDMQHFRLAVAPDSGTKFAYRYYSKQDCGTVGCVIGWSVFAPGLEPIDSDFYEKYNRRDSFGLNFSSYTDRVFFYDNFHIGNNSEMYNFLFSGAWSGYNNTLEGAIKRLEYLIKHDGKLNFIETYKNPDSLSIQIPINTELKDWIT